MIIKQNKCYSYWNLYYKSQFFVKMYYALKIIKMQFMYLTLVQSFMFCTVISVMMWRVYIKTLFFKGFNISEIIFSLLINLVVEILKHAVLLLSDHHSYYRQMKWRSLFLSVISKTDDRSLQWLSGKDEWSGWKKMNFKKLFFN